MIFELTKINYFKFTFYEENLLKNDYPGKKQLVIIALIPDAFKRDYVYCRLKDRS